MKKESNSFLWSCLFILITIWGLNINIRQNKIIKEIRKEYLEDAPIKVVNDSIFYYVEYKN